MADGATSPTPLWVRAILAGMFLLAPGIMLGILLTVASPMPSGNRAALDGVAWGISLIGVLNILLGIYWHRSAADR